MPIISETVTVSVRAPSRLAFSLIGLSPEEIRINGGAGVAISDPYFECKINPAETILVAGEAFPYQEEIRAFLEILLTHLQTEPVALTVEKHIPPHMGFGSKTATLLAVGRGVAALYGKDISTRELAYIAKRGRTSGIGVSTFDRGGFVIDGGHSRPIGSPEEIFVPTRFSEQKNLPPVLLRSDFPWPLLIILPVGYVFEGQKELDHFRRICPIPVSAVHEIAYLICFQMATAVSEIDYCAFCDSINRLQRAYWKARQLELQSHEVQYIYSHAIDHGIDAIGLSSNGPALYALSKRRSEVDAWLDKMMQTGKVMSYWWTESPKQGVSITIKRAQES